MTRLTSQISQTMKTIQIEDDIYSHILRNTTFIGEDASSILRRLLRISQPNARRAATASEPSEPAGDTPSRIDDCLTSPQVRAERNAVGRFMAILSWLYQHHRDEFDKTRMIEGRRRRYFGRSEIELEESGSSVNAQQIPNSPYWVVTNNDTLKKTRMLGDVLRILGYGTVDIRKVAYALD